MFYLVDDTAPRPPWNKGKLIGQKKPLKLKEIWTIRVRLQMAGDVRGLAMFNLAIDSKLRACDLVKLRVTDVTHGSVVMRRATVMQQKTHQRVQFEITEDTREAVSVEQQRSAGLANRQVAEFIKYQQIRVDHAVRQTPLIPRLLFLF
jgi:hypothetical protein